MNAHVEPGKQGTPVGKIILFGCGGLLLAVAIFVAVLFGIVRMATGGVEEVVQDFLAAAARKDYDAAHAHFSAPLKQVQPLETFRASAEANAHLFDVIDTSFSSRSISVTDGAELSGSVTLRSGTKMPASFRLVDEGGKWKLLAYNIGDSD
jgi:hypothetical protein